MPTPNPYLDYAGKADRLSGGVSMIPITTPKGDFRVWTKRVGNYPSLKLLLLHGGPGATHECFEAFDSYLPAAGTLLEWDRTGDLERIDVPTLVIGARHDTMDPAHMETMAGRFPRGRYLGCPNGSHLAMYDDQETYFNGLVEFLLNVGGDR